MKLAIVAALFASASAFSTPKVVTTAFKGTTKVSPVVLNSIGSEVPNDFEMFPDGTFKNIRLIQGGKTTVTWKMPPWTERCQYTLSTNGRPLHATVEMWVGPIRRTHQMKIDMHDGSKTPYKATLKFKKIAPTIRIITSDHLEYPILADVSVPSPERAKLLAKNTDEIWEGATPDQKQLIQGGHTTGGGGAIRTWNIPDDVDSVQLVAWSKDTSKKSFRAKIEVLQGPNNHKQDFFLQCGGGSQPYHGVIKTPGFGWIIRAINDKFVEDGLTQFAVVPYTKVDEASLLEPTVSGYW